MTTADGVVSVGAFIPRSPGSNARKCERCGGLAWFTKASIANALTVAAGAPITWICEGCISEVEAADDATVPAFTAAQIAELHAAGVDASAEQIQAALQRTGKALLRRKGRRT